ncbi:periplasmic heavy metal sensor [Longitalea arenae]|uniref:periplasmic heavy metal sensor n=1 Tax=Longitalea arenae TaxID=2812558 RepID=UPI00196883EF|nr:periplasmic heavy metal sensor [Longitalea arenae]
MMRPPRQKWLLVLVAILLLTNIATLSIYWIKKPNRDEGRDAGKKRMGQFMVDQMRFDAAQEAAYWKLRDSVMAIQKPVMDSMRAAKKNFFDLLNQPNPSDSVLVQRSNEIAELQKKLDIVTFHHFQKVRAICRPDQLQKFDTVIKEIVNRMTPFRRKQ